MSDETAIKAGVTVMLQFYFSIMLVSFIHLDILSVFETMKRKFNLCEAVKDTAFRFRTIQQGELQCVMCDRVGRMN